MSAEVKPPDGFAVFVTSRDCVNTWSWFPTLAAAAKFVEKILTENGGVAVQATVLEVLSMAKVEPVVKWTALKQEAPQTPEAAPPLVPPELLEKIPANDPKIELYPVGCNNRLRAEGKASPRTCAVCRLGPCMGAVHTP